MTSYRVSCKVNRWCQSETERERERERESRLSFSLSLFSFCKPQASVKKDMAAESFSLGYSKTVKEKCLEGEDDLILALFYMQYEHSKLAPGFEEKKSQVSYER